MTPVSKASPHQASGGHGPRIHSDAAQLPPVVLDLLPHQSRGHRPRFSGPGRPGPRIGLSRPGPSVNRLVERQLSAVVVEVLGAVVVHLSQAHPVLKERVPADREVHRATQ